MLRLEAEASAMRIRLAALPLCRSVQKVSAVKLYTRFRCKHFENASARRLKNFGGELQPTLCILLEHPVVVVTLPEFQLLVILIDARTDRRGLRKIKRRAPNRAQFSGRDQSRIYRRKLRGAKEQL